MVHRLSFLNPLEVLGKEILCPRPYLPLFFYVFSRLLARAEMNQRIHGVKILRESPPISHLMYADDIVIFCRADEMEARAIVECLGTFAAWSRQLINFDKSVVHFSKIWRITLRSRSLKF